MRACRWTKRRGFVLLMTLLLIPVIAAAVVGVSRLSLERALAAKHAQEQMQLRWGRRSIQTALVPRLADLLDQAQPRRPEPVTRLGGTVDLGGMSFELRLSDEQAKANLNTLWRERGPRRTHHWLGELRLETATAPPVTLRPRTDAGDAEGRSSHTAIQRRRVAIAAEEDDPDATGPDGIPRFEAWGQVFAAPAPAALLGRSGESDRAPAATPQLEPQPVQGVADRLTLWGNGQLNHRRAEPAALEAVLRPLLGPGDIQRLLEARRRQPGLSLSELLRQLQLDEDRVAEVQRRLTGFSRCHSLWIVAHGPHRRWHRLVVSEGGARPRVFDW